MKSYGFIILLVLFAGACTEQVPPPLQHAISGTTMGTTFSVKYVDDSSVSLPAIAEVEAEINRLLVEVNRQMSTYIPDSEISEFNRSGSAGWFPVSADFVRVMQAAKELAISTNGALDITLGPVINLWGFGNDGRISTPPDKAQLLQLLEQIGHQKIEVQAQPPALRKQSAELSCDLSAIAKGFGVDKIAEYLRSLGLQNYMVEIGGEVRTSGRNQQGFFWRLGVMTPDTPGGVQKVIRLNEESMATSGDYLNYFEEDGVRYSHTIDPATGYPITHKLASVTVIHESCMIADGLATAINVLGPEKGFQLAIEQDLAVYMIIREDEGFVEKMSPVFDTIFRRKENEQ